MGMAAKSMPIRWDILLYRYHPRRLSPAQLLVAAAALLVLFQYNVVYSRTMYHQAHKAPQPVYGQPIAKIVHQSWVSLETIPASVKKHKTVESWKALNPSYQYRFWSDDDIPIFVARHFPEYAILFQRFPVDIMRSDFFRYLAVLKYGGVWSDIDTLCLQPIDKWAPTMAPRGVSMMIGVELDASDVLLDWWSLQLQFTQWTFAAAPNHPIMRHVVEFIYQRFKAMPNIPTHVHIVTGPSIWTEAILDYFAKTTGVSSIHGFRFLKEPMLLGDVAIMPVTSFNPTNPPMGGRGIADPASLSAHLFLGSWKE
ncbi:hypothetical protein SDRG_09345 [Saprolegnia diclina VS20]|uniref:Uncharacterized protein n=1 Tax=Saprolegnia diclina (strain VS20) TaxID=1156394 RepID=T0RRN7_SAPDV|nr:hypothetical protein SDRG_09345 [Saprolegnia diclina VS20]EQC32807.1 hypothetical protein SDRG_09345 [Saprolegnia diclina VS20]|eukprot:XP_008613493.1 hypothetical protein SDRG_09345 [Saprolegnia diclina VS20]